MKKIGQRYLASNITEDHTFQTVDQEFQDKYLQDLESNSADMTYGFEAWSLH